MPQQVVLIKVTPNTAQILQQAQIGGPSAVGGAADLAGRLQTLADELGVTMEPVHPGETDPELASFFTVVVPDDQDVEAVRARFDDHDATEAAYVKPPDYLP